MYGVDCAREFFRGLGVVDVCINCVSSSNICVESGVVFRGVFFIKCDWVVTLFLVRNLYSLVVMWLGFWQRCWDVCE